MPTSLDQKIQDMVFYGDVDLAELDEDRFIHWFIGTFNDVPIISARLPDPEFQGLASRYGV
jgi:hypothetical protein